MTVQFLLFMFIPLFSGHASETLGKWEGAGIIQNENEREYCQNIEVAIAKTTDPLTSDSAKIVFQATISCEKKWYSFSPPAYSQIDGLLHDQNGQVRGKIDQQHLRLKIEGVLFNFVTVNPSHLAIDAEIDAEGQQLLFFLTGSLLRQ